MKHRIRITTILLILALHAAPALATQQVLGLRPATEHGSVAVRLDLEEGEVLSGVRWLHNDGTLAFPKLLLLEAEGENPPDLNRTGVILTELSGVQLSWGEATLPNPVQSSTGSIHAVFVYPPQTETTRLGDGGGPGIGIGADAADAQFWISADGLEWVRFAQEDRLQVRAITQVAAKAGQDVQLLSELAAEIDYFGTKDEIPQITRNELYAPFPNPFNPSTTVRYDVHTPASVELVIFDVRGRKVATLVDGEQARGRYELIWHGSDSRGRAVASGVYLVRLRIAEERFLRRVALVR